MIMSKVKMAFKTLKTINLIELNCFLPVSGNQL